MNVRTLRPDDLPAASAVLFEAFKRSAGARGYRPPWADDLQARNLLERAADDDRERVLVAEEGGAVVGVGAVRLRGEVASIGPIAAYVDGHGIGSALLDGLLEHADEAGAAATRLYVDAWNPPAYALYAGRGFGVVDVAMHIEREPGAPPALASSRGLEVRPFEAKDLDELARFDHKLTGHERQRDLASLVRQVARRHGSIVGYLAAQSIGDRVWLGPAVAVDASDLFTLLANGLIAATRGDDWIESGKPVHARLSTAAPPASMAALGLGFQVAELGVVMSRGAPPPTRPTQLYSPAPEIL